jgi:hypothetical protein
MERSTAHGSHQHCYQICEQILDLENYSEPLSRNARSIGRIDCLYLKAATTAPLRTVIIVLARLNFRHGRQNGTRAHGISSAGSSTQLRLAGERHRKSPSRRCAKVQGSLCSENGSSSPNSSAVCHSRWKTYVNVELNHNQLQGRPSAFPADNPRAHSPSPRCSLLRARAGLG